MVHLPESFLESGRWVAPLRWFGRLIGGLGALMWTLALTAHTIAEYEEVTDPTFESVGILVLVVANVASYLLALRWERPWAWVLMAVSALFVGFAVITAGRNHLLAAAVSGGPFLVAAAALLVASQPSDPELPSHHEASQAA